VKRFLPGLFVWTIVALAAGRGYAAVTAAAVSGTVRDMHGTPQMGTLVELLSGDATVIVSAFSDAHGRYIMPTVVPGKYQLRASAAFFVPVLRNNLRLTAGTQSIVNLTAGAAPAG
jgi:protocatechuate 3,4-dioxygenase beta subunit